MAVIVRFTTGKFDVSRERRNPINPIRGESLLHWLRQALEPDLWIGGPEPEDWGWLATLTWEGRRFMLGSSATDEPGAAREWVLQIVPVRSLADRLFRRGQVTADHPLVLRLVSLLSQEAAFVGVSVEGEA